MAGEENAHKYRGLIYLVSSASAEFLADIALCPNEMVFRPLSLSLLLLAPTSDLGSKLWALGSGLWALGSGLWALARVLLRVLVLVGVRVLVCFVFVALPLFLSALSYDCVCPVLCCLCLVLPCDRFVSPCLAVVL
jgi:hypothetical protein